MSTITSKFRLQFGPDQAGPPATRQFASLEVLPPEGLSEYIERPAHARSFPLDDDRRLHHEVHPETGRTRPKPEPHAGASVYDHSRRAGTDPRGLRNYIRQQAALNGIDPDVAVRVAESEGLGHFLGDHGKSGGAFQLHTGGGLGNKFRRETGLDPLDPANERATIAWAMRYAAKTKSWAPWHGAARVGIGHHVGFGNRPRVISETPSASEHLSQKRLLDGARAPEGTFVRPSADTRPHEFTDITLGGRGATGLAPEFRRRLDAYLAAHPEYRIVGGFRSHARQSALYAASHAKGHMVARPGHSFHELGIAADLGPAGGGSLAGRRLPDLERFGLWQPMPWEPWHVEPLIRSSNR